MALHILRRGICRYPRKLHFSRVLSCEGKPHRDSRGPRHRPSFDQAVVRDKSKAEKEASKKPTDISPRFSCRSCLAVKTGQGRSALPSKCTVPTKYNSLEPFDPNMGPHPQHVGARQAIGKDLAELPESPKSRNESKAVTNTSKLDTAISHGNERIKAILNGCNKNPVLDTTLYTRIQEQGILPVLREFLPELLNHPTSWTISHRKAGNGCWTMYIATSNTPLQEGEEISHWLDQLLPFDLRDKITVHFSQGSVIRSSTGGTHPISLVPNNTIEKPAQNTGYHKDYTAGDSVGERGTIAGTLGPTVLIAGQMYYICSDHIFGDGAGPVFHPAPAEQQPEDVEIGRVEKRREGAPEWCHHGPSSNLLGEDIPGFSSVLDYRLVTASTATPLRALSMRDTDSKDHSAVCPHITSYARITPESHVQTSGRTSGGIRDSKMSPMRSTVSHKGKIAEEWELVSESGVLPDIGAAGDSGGVVTTKDQIGRRILCGVIWGRGQENQAYVTDIVCLLNAIREQYEFTDLPSLIKCGCKKGPRLRRYKLYFSDLWKKLSRRSKECASDCCPSSVNVNVDPHFQQPMDGLEEEHLQPTPSSFRARSGSELSAASPVNTIFTTHKQAYTTQNTSAGRSEEDLASPSSTDSHEIFPEVLKAKLEQFKAQPEQSNRV